MNSKSIGKRTMKFVETPEMVENALQRFVHTVNGNFQESMDNDVQHRQESETHIAKENWQLSLSGRIVW